MLCRNKSYLFIWIGRRAELSVFVTRVGVVVRTSERLARSTPLQALFTNVVGIKLSFCGGEPIETAIPRIEDPLLDTETFVIGKLTGRKLQLSWAQTK